jgi:tetratricopeptide (TPR) repeat protein
MAERSVEAAYQAGHVYRCLQEIEALVRAGQATGKMLTCAANTHMYLGHYREAADTLEKALQSDDPWVPAMRGGFWNQLGNVYDLLGERPKAEEAYQRALSEPDQWAGAAHSLHALAHRYLKQPFTEQDLQAMLRPTGKGARGRRARRR